MPYVRPSMFNHPEWVHLGGGSGDTSNPLDIGVVVPVGGGSDLQYAAAVYGAWGQGAEILGYWSGGGAPQPPPRPPNNAGDVYNWFDDTQNTRTIVFDEDGNTQITVFFNKRDETQPWLTDSDLGGLGFMRAWAGGEYTLEIFKRIPYDFPPPPPPPPPEPCPRPDWPYTDPQLNAGEGSWASVRFKSYH